MLFYKPNMVQKMKRDSGWNMLHKWKPLCSSSISTCPFVRPQNSILTSTIILNLHWNVSQYLLTSRPTLLPTSFWAFQGQRSHITAQNFRCGPEVGWERPGAFPSHPNLTYPRSFWKWLYFASTPLCDSKANRKLTWVLLQVKKTTASARYSSDHTVYWWSVIACKRSDTKVL